VTPLPSHPSRCLLCVLTLTVMAGEEEESLTDFIVSKLQNRRPPDEILEELSVVLDDDAEQFVVKLWRMLVYYSLKP